MGFVTSSGWANMCLHHPLNPSMMRKRNVNPTKFRENLLGDLPAELEESKKVTRRHSNKMAVPQLIEKEPQRGLNDNEGAIGKRHQTE